MQSLKIVLLELRVADASISFVDASTKIENVILNITKIFSRLSSIRYDTIICYIPKRRIEISNVNTRNQFQVALLFKEFAAGYISKMVSLFFRI